MSFYRWIYFFSDKKLIDKSLNLRKDNFKKNIFIDYQLFLTWHNYSKINYSLSNYHFLLSDSVNSNYYSAVSSYNLNFIAIWKNLINPFNPHNLYLRYEYENEIEIFDSFLFLRASSFINFFITNLIDTPNCFKKIKSIKRRVFELPVLKLINFLTKKGKREKFQIIFFKALNAFYQQDTFANNTKGVKKFPYKWIGLYLFFNNLYVSHNHFLNSRIKIDQLFNYEINYDHIIHDDGKLISKNGYLVNNLLKKFSIVSPLFTFFVHNVDKNVKKYSRGKSGKYSFVWKYIPLYKRNYVSFKLIMKDIKFTNGRILHERIKNTIANIFFEPQKSFIWKSKIFAYNYVFKNYKKTLMQTLKTVK